MKHKIVFLVLLFSAITKLNAQTRFYSIGYSNIPIELSGIAEEAVHGNFGLQISTQKYRNCHLMSGYSLSFNKLSLTETGSIYYQPEGSYNYSYADVTRTLTVQKYTASYDIIGLWGGKEIDDQWAMYGVFSSFIAYNHAKEEFASDAPIHPMEGYNDVIYSPIDFGIKFGLGYQQMINTQWALYGDAKAYLSMAGSVGVEYNLGVRYRGLGKR